jgi:hypothetical protein
MKQNEKLSTSLSYFMPRHTFCSIESAEIWPVEIRPSDPELTVDKAMIMLGIAEEQIRRIIAADAFNPSDLGFEHRTVGGETEFDGADLWISPNGKFWMSRGEKPMTYVINKMVQTEDEGAPGLTAENDVEVFIPSDLVGKIVLQSLGVLDMVNPSGIYVHDTQQNQVEEPVAVTSNDPIIVFHNVKFSDPKDRDAFLLEKGVVDENGKQVKKAAILPDEPLQAMEVIRYIIKERDSGLLFEGVVDAINNHSNLTDAQKQKMIEEYTPEF